MSDVEHDRPLLMWKIPSSNKHDGVLEIPIQANDHLFIVGPNGSGKSALVQHFVYPVRNHPVRRISAHRQTWLESSAINLTAKSRLPVETNIKQNEAADESRWKDALVHQRLNAVLFDLVATENRRARAIAALVDDDELEDASK
jgi:ABC-type phosphate/phosphonate transport system ATPase subunit